MGTWRIAILRVALLTLCAAFSVAGDPRPVAAQKAPPLPRTSVAVYHLVAGAWRPTKAVRLGERLRFQMRVQTHAALRPISGAALRLRETRLEQDGLYYYFGTLYQAEMQLSILTGGDLLFRKELRLGDKRMVGKVLAEFVVHYGEGEFGRDLLLTVKPIHGNIPGGNPGSDTYWGLKMTIQLPQRTYPRDALVQAQVRVQNLSGQVRTIQSGYCSHPPWIEALDARGHALPRFSFDGGGPTCHGIISTQIPPDSSIEQQQYVVLASERLRVATTIGDLHVAGQALLLHLAPAAPLKLSIQETGSAITALLQPSRPVSGPLYYGYRIECTFIGQMVAFQGTHTWQSTAGSTLSVSRPSACDPTAPWDIHALAGWLGQSVAHIDVVGRKPVPCDRGLVGRLPALTDVSPQTLATIGISLLPPQSPGTVCQAQAIYQIRLPFGGSTPPQAALAQISSRSDPRIDGHLAWTVLTHSLDPNHPANPPVLYLSLVDARAGVVLDTVYSGGLHPPGPPAHLHTVPPSEEESMVLSATRDTPPLSEAQARQALANAPRGQGAAVREAVLARVYNPNTPLLWDHLCWIFSVTPPGYEEEVQKGGFWLIYVDAETGQVLMAGGTVPPGPSLPASGRRAPW